MASANHSKCLTLKILNSLNNRSYNFPTVTRKTTTTELKPSQDYVLVSSISKLFEQTHIICQVSKPNFKVNHFSLRGPPLPVPPTSTRFYSKVTNYRLVLSLPSNLKTPVGFIRNIPKSKYLHNQLRFFKAENHSKMEPNGNASLFRRIKYFFGFGSVTSENPTNRSLGKELQRFQSNWNKENLSPELMQKLRVSFIEGYSFALDNVIQQSSSRIYLLITCVVIGYLVGILLTKPASIFNFGLGIANSTMKFDDVKGAEEAKQELQNIVEFLKHPEKFSALGGKLPKGVLLVGPPGTGKTLLAKAVAGEAGVPFFCTSGSEFDEVYVGMGARRIRDLFKMAKENTPCVVFIDEIDSIGKQRTSSPNHPYANDTINQLLSEMDGFKNNKGVIVLGATNRRKDLDKALLRPGRFDVEVVVLVPDYRGRKELLEFYLGKVQHQNVDIEKLARGTTNFTGADIENLVNQAAVRAAGAGANYVTGEHLEYARDKTLMGPESLSRVTDEETNRITAYHESGHVLVAHYTKHAPPLHKVTIIARGGSLGHTAYIPDRDMHHVTRGQLLASLDITMAGRAAEEVVFGPNSVTSGASGDLEKATLQATKMVRMWGMSDAVGLMTYSGHTFTSPETANLIDKEIKTLLQESYERAKSILTEHKEKHKELSEALLKEETLDASEVAAILKDN